MQHKINFYPIGNADTTLIELDNNQKILFDYANMRSDDIFRDESENFNLQQYYPFHR